MTLSQPYVIGKRITEKKARKYIKDCRAVWADDSHSAIRFRINDQRHQSAQASIRHQEIAAMAGYDRSSQTGIANRKQLQGLPMLGDVARMLTLPTTCGNGDKRGVFKDA